MKRIVAVALLFLLTGCNPVMDGFKPGSVWMAQAPEGPPEYVQGWKDGCESGMSAYGNSFYRTFYKFKQDPAMVKNETYYRTWQDSFNYCRHYTLANQKHGFTVSGGGFNPRNPDVAFDLRDQRDVQRDGLGLPGSNGLTLPSWGEDVEEEDTLGKAMWGDAW
ncbi:MAG: hypothetical protein EB060_07095 [Proteobacteria bacterium]|nr:hypothetical protein [Pseudomonadota bacterium]